MNISRVLPLQYKKHGNSLYKLFPCFLYRKGLTILVVLIKLKNNKCDCNSLSASQAQELMDKMEHTALRVELHMNGKETNL